MANSDLDKTIAETQPTQPSSQVEAPSIDLGTRYVLGDRLGRGGMAVV